MAFWLLRKDNSLGWFVYNSTLAILWLTFRISGVHTRSENKWQTSPEIMLSPPMRKVSKHRTVLQKAKNLVRNVPQSLSGRAWLSSSYNFGVFVQRELCQLSMRGAWDSLWRSHFNWATRCARLNCLQRVKRYYSTIYCGWSKSFLVWRSPDT